MRRTPPPKSASASMNCSSPTMFGSPPIMSKTWKPSSAAITVTAAVSADHETAPDPRTAAVMALRTSGTRSPSVSVKRNSRSNRRRSRRICGGNRELLARPSCCRHCGSLGDGIRHTASHLSARREPPDTSRQCVSSVGNRVSERQAWRGLRGAWPISPATVLRRCAPGRPDRRPHHTSRPAPRAALCAGLCRSSSSTHSLAGAPLAWSSGSSPARCA
jgi:hypothetical protein